MAQKLTQQQLDALYALLDATARRGVRRSPGEGAKVAERAATTLGGYAGGFLEPTPFFDEDSMLKEAWKLYKDAGETYGFTPAEVGSMEEFAKSFGRLSRKAKIDWVEAYRDAAPFMPQRIHNFYGLGIPPGAESVVNIPVAKEIPQAAVKEIPQAVESQVVKVIPKPVGLISAGLTRGTGK